MKYLFLAYGDEQRLEAMSSSERDAFEHACLANNETMRERGYLLAVAGLHNSNGAVIVRLHNKEVSVIDGALAMTKEPLIGLYFIDARDLNEAIQVAMQMPQTCGGPIEVRPLMVSTHKKRILCEF